MGGVVFVIWLGAWLVLSGTVHRAIQGAQDYFIQVSVNQGLVVRNVLVQGRENTDPDVLRALVNIDEGAPILTFNPHEVRELIERISWVREAHVERRFPDTVYIGLIERQPLALWQNKGKIRLIDGDGVVLADRNLDRFSDLLIIVGEDAPARTPELTAMIAAEPLLQGRIEAAVRVGGRRWDLRTKDGIAVNLPERDMGLALRRLAQAQEADGLLDKDLSLIDLRNADRIIVRTKPGAVSEYKASLVRSGNI